MNLTHLHLLTTHLPMYGSIMGMLILAYGMSTRSVHTRIAAYYVLLISAIGGIVAFSTGDAAEDTVKNIQGIGKNMLEDHESFAKITMRLIIAMGVLSPVGLILASKKSRFAKAISIFVFIASLICFGMRAWTGYLGSQIRHTEINVGSASQGYEGEHNSD